MYRLVYRTCTEDADVDVYVFEHPFGGFWIGFEEQILDDSRVVFELTEENLEVLEQAIIITRAQLRGKE
jgi:hypothetical protein